jgi:hypothetical protein
LLLSCALFLFPFAQTFPRFFSITNSL